MASKSLFKSKNLMNNPGPGHYQQDRRLKDKGYSFTASKSVSQLNTIGGVSITEINSKPGPGQYDGNPRTSKDSLKQGPLFPKELKGKNVIEAPGKQYEPGPGAYDP